MDWKSPQSFLVPVLFVGFIIWRFARFRGVKHQIPALLSGGAVIVGVLL